MLPEASHVKEADEDDDNNEDEEEENEEEGLEQLESHFLNFWPRIEFIIKFPYKAPLHTAAEPAVHAAVKTQVSYRNDTKPAFFFAAS